MKRAVLVKKQLFDLITVKNEYKLDNFYDVKLKIEYCGICGSDISKYMEHKKTNYPLILGHEFCGYVSEGPDNINKDNLYVGIPLLYCNECSNCKNKNYQLCTNQKFIGSTIPGAMQEYMLTNSNYLMEVNNLKSNPELATLIEPTANVIHAYELLNHKIARKKVAIIGNGTIGALLNLYLKIKEPNSKIDVLNRQNEGKANYYDYVFECSGTTSGLEKALKITKYKGTIINIGILYANCFTKADLDFDLLLRKELKMLGSWNSNFTTDWLEAYNIISNNKDEFLNIIDLIYPLEKISEAFELKVNTPVRKIVLKINEKSS